MMTSQDDPHPHSTGLTRRSAIAVLSAAGLAPHVAAANAGAEHGQPRLWYRQPAHSWEAALPVGNGRLGAMVFGRVGQERLQLNEDTLWAGAPYTADSPDAYPALDEVRRLIAAGEYKKASDLASVTMMGRPRGQMPYGTLGDLLIDFPDAQIPAHYEQSLELSDAVVVTRYGRPGGSMRREVFASAPDQLIVMRLESTGGAIDLNLSYRGPGPTKHPAPNYTGPATEAAQLVEWLQREAPGERPDHVRIEPDGPDAILIVGRNEPAETVAGGLTYAMRVKLVSDGKIVALAEGLTLRGARHATLLIAAATSYAGRDRVDADPLPVVRRHTEAGARKSFAALKRDHVRAHQALFNTMSIELGEEEAARRPTDERIRAAESGKDAALAALYLQYGRYLLISSSRPGTQPANLQGIWNDGTNPPWGSKYTININTEMNYWPADPANLPLCVEPLLRMVEELAVSGAKTAKAMYRAGGWVAHHNTDLWRATAPIDGPEWGLWPMGGAWLCNTLWDHWDYVRDDVFLRRLYPLMQGASQFFLDMLVDDPRGRGLITSPSISPENQHPFGSAVCAGPAMDRQILRDLFQRTIDAGEQLGDGDRAFRDRIAAARARLAPDRIGTSGQLQEWLEDWDADAPEQQHRHVSHLYAAYPSAQINVRDTPDLASAAKVTLNTRGDISTGWATAWRLCLWARLGDAERAHRILLGLLGPERTYPNMFDAHPPFQIDGNFGGTAGIIEMLVQSWGKELLILPALPQAWGKGAIRGARARGGLVVDLEWSEGRLRNLAIKGKAGTAVAVRYRGMLHERSLDRTGALRMTGSDLAEPGR